MISVCVACGRCVLHVVRTDSKSWVCVVRLCACVAYRAYVCTRSAHDACTNTCVLTVEARLLDDVRYLTCVSCVTFSGNEARLLNDVRYGLATVSRLLKIIGLFCRV